MLTEDNIKPLFKNLVIIAQSDGEISPLEEKLLAKVRSKYNLSLELQQKIIKKTDNISTRPVKTKKEKFLYLFAMIDMVCANKAIKDCEQEMVEKIALNLGFKKIYLKRLISYIIKYRLEGSSNSDIYKKISTLKSLNFT